MKSSHLLVVLIFSGIIISKIVSHAPDMLALMIPIILIVVFSPIGRAWANRINGNSFNNSDYQDLKNKYSLLESKLEEYHNELNKMRESIIFYESKKLDTSHIYSNSSETDKQDLLKKINLDKQKDL